MAGSMGGSGTGMRSDSKRGVAAVARRRRTSLARRRAGLLTLLAMVLLSVVPAANAAEAGAGGFPWPNVVSWFASGPGAARLPQEASALLAGLSHTASAGSTQAGVGSGKPPGKGNGELDAAPSLARKVKTGPSAKKPSGFNAKTSKEDPAKRTKTSTTFDNADGSTTVDYYSSPVNYTAPDGTVQPIDTTLVSSTKAGGAKTKATGAGVASAMDVAASAGGDGGRLVPAASGGTVSFAATGDDPALETVGDGINSVSFAVQGASAVPAVTSGSQATYASILPGVDLQLLAGTTGAKQTLVLGSAAAPTTYVFPYTTSAGLSAKRVDGGVEFVDASGAGIFVPDAIAIDSASIPGYGQGAQTNKVTYSLITTADGKPALEMDLDAAWLADPSRVFPVMVDPTASPIQANDTATMDTTNSPMGTYSGDLKTGSYDGTHRGAAFVEFSGVSADKSLDIVGASVNLWHTYSSSCSATEPISLWGIAGNWNVSSISSYPGVSYDSSAALGSLSVHGEGSNCSGSAWDYVPLNSYGVDELHRWAIGNMVNYGFLVTGETADSSGWMRFNSFAEGGVVIPSLSVTYQNVAPQIDSSYPGNAASLGTLTPELLATAHDPDNYPGTGLQYDFTVWDSTGKQVVDSGTVSSGDWQIPSTANLKWNQTYSWVVQASDGVNASASQGSFFTLSPPQPPITSVLSQDSGRGFDPGSGNYTTTATDADVPGVGPTLQVTRDYNSLDPRTGGAFGAAWSSVFDAKATEQYLPDGSVGSVDVTYPDGSEVGWGRNPGDGSFTAPPGRYAQLKYITNVGYTLTDKNDTVYSFTHETSAGVYGITAVTDALDRSVSFGWSLAGHITTMKSGSTGRTLTLGWLNGSFFNPARVLTVTTDPVTSDPNSALVWHYYYNTNDQLTSVCSPVDHQNPDGSGCTQYSYTSGPLFTPTLLDTAPQSYWRLNELAGSTAASSVLANEGADNLTYTGVTLGQPSGLTGSAATSVAFAGGTSSYIASSTPYLAVDGSFVSVGAWFKTTTAGGVIFYYGDKPMANAGATTTNTPALYVGTDGKLHGCFATSSCTTSVLSSGSAVTDGNWHYALLSGSGTSQTLYLDGSAVGQLPGSIQSAKQQYIAIGAGVGGHGWPYLNSGVDGFTGSLSDVAVWNKPLTQAQAYALSIAGSWPMSLLTKITKPAQNVVEAQIAYNPRTGSVEQVTDAQGGVWTVPAPTASGSSQVYRSAVLGAAPQGYWPLGDPAGYATATDEVDGSGQDMVYNGVTLGQPGVFGDATAASFDGSTSYASSGPASLVDTSGSFSVSAWVKLSDTSGYHAVAVQTNTNGGYGFWLGYDHGLNAWALTTSNVASSAPTAWYSAAGPAGSAATGVWTHLVGTFDKSSGKLSLYVNGTLQSRQATWPAPFAVAGPLNIGMANGDSHFPGSISDVAIFRAALSGAQVSAMWSAYKNSANVVNPSSIVPATSTKTLTPTASAVAVNASGTGTVQLAFDNTVYAGGQTWYSGGLTSDKASATLSFTTDGNLVDSGKNSATLWSSNTGGHPGAVLVPQTDGNLVIYTDSTKSTALWSSGTNLGAGNYLDFTPDGSLTIFKPGSVTGDDAPVWTFASPVTNAAGVISTVLDANSGRQLAVTDALGHASQYGYDIGGFLYTVTDAAGHTTTTGHDVRGNVVSKKTCQVQASNLCSTTYFTYWPDDVTVNPPPDPRNDLVTSTRDARSSGPGDNTYLTSITYDAYGNQTSTTTPPVPGFLSGRTTATTYGTAVFNSGLESASLAGWNGNTRNATATTSTAHSGLYSAALIAPSGGDAAIEQVVTGLTPGTAYTVTGWVSASDGVATWFGAKNYDSSGTQNSGSSTSTAWTQLSTTFTTGPTSTSALVFCWRGSAGTSNCDDITIAKQGGTPVPPGLPVAVTTAGGHTTSTAYFPTGDIASTTDAAGMVTAYTYDNLGQPATKSVTYNTPTLGSTTATTMYKVDGLGRITKQTDPTTVDRVTGATHVPATVTGYDLDGDIQTVTVEDDTNVGQPDASRTTTNSYDNHDQLSQVQDPLGHVTTYGYDLYGNRTSVTDADGNETDTAYDPAGHQLSTTVKNYNFDPAHPSPADLVTESRGYDAAGRPAWVADPLGTTSYTYTDDGLVAKVTRTDIHNANPFVLQDNSYDPAGNLISRTTNNEKIVTTYQVDAASRVASQTLDPVGVDRTTSYSFDPDDAVTSVSLRDNTGWFRTTTASFDTMGRQIGQTVHDVTTTSAPDHNAGLAGSWTLADGISAAAADSSGANLNGNLNGGVSWSTDHSGSAAFDGSTGTITTATSPVDTTKSFTVSAWIKPNVTGGVAVSQKGANSSGFILYPDHSLNKWAFGAGTQDAGWNFDEALGPVPALNTWTHVTGVYDATAGTISLYVNGTLAGTHSHTATFNAAGGLLMGAYLNGGVVGSDFNGTISQVRTYNRALSATEVNGLYVGDPTKGLPQNGLTGQWNLADGNVATATDTSGGSNPGTLTGGVSWSADNQGSAVFDGTTGTITTTKPVLDTTKDFSVAAWVKTPTPTSGSQTAVVQKATTAGGFYLEDVNGKWQFSRVNADTTNPTIDAAVSNTAATTAWTHLVGTYSASSHLMTLYVNGSAQTSTATDTTPIPSTGPLVIGHGYYNGAANNLFKGQISGVQAYDRVLTATEANTLSTGGTITSNDTTATTHWDLDQRGLPVDVTDPNLNITRYDYDQAGRKTVTYAPAVSTETGGGAPTTTIPTTTVGYDTFGETVETLDPNSNKTTIDYDADGHPYRTTQPTVAGITPVATRTYDPAGNLQTSIDPVGNQPGNNPLAHTTTYTYDAQNRVQTVTAPAAGTTTTIYDAAGNVSSITDGNGAQTGTVWDYLGRKQTSSAVVRDPSGQAAPKTDTTTYNYDPANGGWLSSTQSPLGVTTSATYDNVGEIATANDSAGNTTKYAYDFMGDRIKTTLPDNSFTTVHYNAWQQPDATAIYTNADPNNPYSTTAKTYDGLGNLKSATDALNHTTTFTYDADSRLTQEVQPIADPGTADPTITTKFGYDMAGNQTDYTDGNNNKWITDYNAWNLPTTLTEPATAQYTAAGDSQITTTYDADGHPVGQGLPGGVSITSGYDAGGNLLTQSGTGAEAATANRTFTYDNDGRVKTASTANAGNQTATTDTFTYDDRGLLLTTTGSAGASTFTYNDDGQMATRADASGTTGYSYTAGLLSSITDAASGTTLNYTYNNLDQLSKIGYGTTQNYRTFGYDLEHRLTSDTLKTAAGSNVASITYGWDPNNNLTSKTTSTGFATYAANIYTYDYANRLTSWNNGTNTVNYVYDNNGNRTQVGTATYTYDTRDQLTSDGTTTYSYTARGTQTAGTGRTAATFDAYGQNVTAGTASYTYDATGRVITGTVTGTGTRSFSYSGTGNLLASDGANLYSRDPFGGLTGIGSVGQSTGSGLTAWTDLHTDVVADFTATGTTLTGSTAYDPLGKQLGTRTIAGNLGYQSEYTETTTGNVNMAARWYNPATGQFTSRDTQSNNPVPNSVEANPFAYGNDDPLTATDPTGHHADSWSDVQESQDGPSFGQAALSWLDGTSIGHALVTTARQVVAVAKVFKRVIKKVLPKLYAAGAKAIGNIKNVVQKAFGSTTVAALVGVAKDLWNAKLPPSEINEPDVIDVGGGLFMSTADPRLEQFLLKGGSIALHGSQLHGEWRISELSDWLGYCTGTDRPDCGDGLIAALQSELYAAKNDGAFGGQAPIFAGYGGAAVLSSMDAYDYQFNGLEDDVAHGYQSKLAAAASKDGFLSNLAMALSMAPIMPGGGGRDGSEDVTSTGGVGPGFEDPGHEGCSFDPATPVLLSNGKVKAISQLAQGDSVEAADPATGKDVGGREVQHVWINHDADLLDVTVNDGHGHNSVLHTTANHPFYDGTTKTFVRADHLSHGDDLASTGGRHPTVTSVTLTPGEADRYNLTVEQLHTYYVLAGDTPVLVHNIGGTCRVPSGQPGAGQFARDPNAVPPTHTRETEYPSGFRQSTHAAMAALWQDPVTGDWLDEQGDIIPPGELTYDHVVPVVEHWNNAGYDMSRVDRIDWYNDVANLRPMSKSQNSSLGGQLTSRYRQDVGPNYSG